MTAADLLRELRRRGVALTPTPTGGVHVRTPAGVIPHELLEAMRAQKEVIHTLLVAPSMRTWVTDMAPRSNTLSITLKAPKYHDTPRPTRTYLGMACTVKACVKSLTTTARGQPASRRFAPTGICVACWERADKKGLYTPEKQAKRLAKLEKQREGAMERVADTQVFPDF